MHLQQQQSPRKGTPRSGQSDSSPSQCHSPRQQRVRRDVERQPSARETRGDGPFGCPFCAAASACDCNDESHGRAKRSVPPCDYCLGKVHHVMTQPGGGIGPTKRACRSSQLLLREEFAPQLLAKNNERGFTDGKMFTVDGWKLGDVVKQTVTPKNNNKRKRDDTQEKSAKDELKTKGHRANPFAFGAAKSKTDPKSLKTESTTGTSDKATDDAPQPQPTISKRQIARNKAEKRAQRKLELSLRTETPASADPLPISQVSSSVPVLGLTPLQQKMRAKLTGSQFRHINEKLYTTHSSEALSLFTIQPSLFHDVLFRLPESLSLLLLSCSSVSHAFLVFFCCSLFLRASRSLMVVPPRLPPPSPILANQPHRSIHLAPLPPPHQNLQDLQTS